MSANEKNNKKQMKKHKILKTLLSLGTIVTIGTIAIIPTIQMVETDSKVTAEDENVILTRGDIQIENVALNNDQADNATYIEVDFTYEISDGENGWVFQPFPAQTANPFYIQVFNKTGSPQTFPNLAGSIIENDAQPRNGEPIVPGAIYKVILKVNGYPNESYYTQDTIWLKIASYSSYIGGAAGTNNLEDMGSVPRKNITNPNNNFIVPNVTNVVQKDNEESELTFNLNPTGVDTRGWIMQRVPIVIADDGVNTPIRITNVSTDIDTSKPATIPTTTGVATFKNSALTVGTEYDISLEWKFGVNDVPIAGEWAPWYPQIVDHVGQTNSVPLTIAETTDPTISNLTISDDLSTLMFTLNLNNDLDFKARFLEDTTRPFALYYGDVSSKTLITEDIITTTEVLPLEGESYLDSYDFTIDTSVLQANDALWGTDDILESLTIAVGYETDDTTVNPYTFSANIGSIPRDVPPSTIDNPTIVSEVTDIEVTFELSNTTTRGWAIAPDGVRIFITPSDGTAQYEATGATFDVDVSAGEAIPQGEITTTIPQSNFYDIKIDYDITIQANYIVGSDLVDILPEPTTVTSAPITLDSSATLGNLTVSQGSVAGSIDLTWSINFVPDVANTVFYIAVRDTLLQADGWKIYSSDQTNFFSISFDNATGIVSATIQDPSFINQGAEYDISISSHLNKNMPDDIVYYGDAWTGWDGSTSSAPIATITVPTFLTVFSAPTTPPEDMNFVYSSSTSQSLIYEFTYDNGSLEFNPIITAEINDGTGLVDVPNADLNVAFNASTGTGRIEILRLVPGNTYTEIIFTYDYLISDPIVFPMPDSATTLPSVSLVTLIVSLVGDTMTLVIGGSEIANVIDSSNADVIITDDNGVSALLSTTSSGAFIGTHDVDLSALDLSTDLFINVIAYDDEVVPGALILENTIISDEVSEATGTIVTYTINGQNAEPSLIEDPTSVTPNEGIQNGELDLSWEIDYPLSVDNPSQLIFTFEVTTVNPDIALPEDWVDVTDQTSNFAEDMKSATISGLNGASYTTGVWVRLTIDYSSVAGYIPASVTSTISAIPKQPEANNTSDGLSMVALIGIIAGSVAGVALIALGLWFYLRKKNKVDEFNKKEQSNTEEVEVVKAVKKTPSKSKSTVKKPTTKKSATKKTTTKKAASKKSVTKKTTKKVDSKTTKTVKKTPSKSKPTPSKKPAAKKSVTKKTTTKKVAPKKPVTKKTTPPKKKPPSPKQIV